MRFIDDKFYPDSVEVTALKILIKKACEEFGVFIGHEDQHGGFEIYDLEDKKDLDWFDGASDMTKKTRPRVAEGVEN